MVRASGWIQSDDERTDDQLRYDRRQYAQVWSLKGKKWDFLCFITLFIPRGFGVYGYSPLCMRLRWITGISLWIVVNNAPMACQRLSFSQQ